MNIFLVGFMGSGKTSIGRALARAAGYAFVDTDDLIVEAEGISIPEIFRKKGEPYFRKVESRVLREAVAGRNRVVSTGGGAMQEPGNVRVLKKNGLIVWLKVTPEIVLERIEADGATRPLLKVAEPLKEIRKLLKKRTPTYQQADLALDTSFLPVKKAVAKLRERLSLSKQRVGVDLGDRSYDILIGRGVLQGLGSRVRGLRPTRVAVVSNPTVFGLYGSRVEASLREAGFDPVRILIPDGEGYKDLLWFYKILGDLLAAGFDRQGLIIALGGGVIGDIAGFAAATYMRGIRCVQVPTTVLAQVDSSVGGKTGVNHPLGKNMIGAFFQPSLVLMDSDTLETLPASELRAGLAEIIKYGVIWDGTLFDRLNEKKTEILALGPALERSIVRSCQIKAEVVRQDERESGLRAILNYGHTFGHAIETLSGYGHFLHGEAVAIGMCVAAEVSARTRRLSRRDVTRVRKLVQAYNLPWAVPGNLTSEAIFEAMGRDKKNVGGTLRLVLPVNIGRVEIVSDVSESTIRRAIDASRKR